jgi:SAM-dependent methyltransferase
VGARSSGEPDVVKQQVAAHWDRRAPGFDTDFGHSIRTAGERAAWDRILDLVVPARGKLDALDVGCGTGFLTFELAARGHRVTGIDFAPAMIAEARRKAAERSVAVRLEEGDAEQLQFAAARFDLVISRHLLWTLPHPEAAIDEWIRVPKPSAPGRRGQPPDAGARSSRPEARSARVRGDRRSAAVPGPPLSPRSSVCGPRTASRTSAATRSMIWSPRRQRMVDEG